MKRLLLISVLLLVAPVAGAAEFVTVKTKNFAKDTFVFPDDVRGGRLNVLFLAMSDDMDNGREQQDKLLEWQAALDAQGLFSADVVAYYFPVLEGVPFFIKGVVSGRMRDSYTGTVPRERAGALFTKDLDGFAAAAELPVDGEPTIVIASADARPLRYFKGEVTPEGVDEIVQAVAELLSE